MADPIAARKGDHHVCLQHIGADILTPCAPTILVEGQEAARVTDLVECLGGPLDMVQIGEPTVLLEGQQAARFADGTAHGGLIDEGAPTVIIGKMTCADKRLRLLERLQLIDAARKKAAETGDTELSEAAERLAQNNRAVEDARLASDVYNDSGAPEGWTRLTGDQLPPELQNATFVDPSTGFASALYRSDIDGSYRLAFRGTQPDSWQDWWHGNLTQGAGWESQQYNQAVELAQQVDSLYGDSLGTTGHSLGGGLASVAALATGSPGNTFNASGVNSDTYDRYGLDGSQADDLIDAYQTDGDILTWAQEESPISGLMPDAIGTTHGLNAVNMTTGPDGSPIFTPREWPPEPTFQHPDSKWGYLNPFGMGRRTKEWAQAELEQEKARALEATERHGLYIDGIEQQKSEDVATIKSKL